MTEAETNQLGVLVRHFFTRFFRNPMVSQDGDLSVTLAEIVAPLAVLGAAACFLALQQRFYLAFIGEPIHPSWFWVNESFHLSLALILCGITTLLVWDELLLDPCDFTNLGSLPVRLPVLFAAKMFSLLGLVGLVALGANAFSAILFPSLLSSDLESMFWWLVVHSSVVFLACLAMFCICVGVQALILFLPGRVAAVVSLFSRWVLVILIFVGLFTLPEVHTALPSLKSDGDWALWLYPPMWFVGLYQWALGQGDRAFDSLARTALLVLAGSALVAATGYAAQYGQHVTGFGGSWRRTDKQLFNFGPPRRLLAILLPDPRQRAVFFFIVQTLFRTHKQLVLWAGFSGVGVALAVSCCLKCLSETGSAGLDSPVWLSLSPLHSLVFFSLAGLRVVFSLPATLEANWIFRSAETSNPRPYFTGLRKAAFALGALPWIALGFAFHLPSWGWSPTLAHCAFGSLLAVVLMEILFFDFRKLPFACALVPENANVKVMWSFYLLGLATYIFGGAALESWLLKTPVGSAGLSLALAAALVFWPGLRSRLFGSRIEVVYRERSEPGVIRIPFE